MKTISHIYSRNFFVNLIVEVEIPGKIFIICVHDSMFYGLEESVMNLKNIISSLLLLVYICMQAIKSQHWHFPTCQSFCECICVHCA